MIGYETGKVLDYHVMSKHCPGCRQWGAKDQTTADYMQWKESHKCKQNYFGSSGGMEPEGAKTMFKQSLQDGVHFTLNHTDDSENVKVGVQLLGHLQILVLICLARTIRSWIGQSISTKLGSKFTSAPHNKVIQQVYRDTNREQCTSWMAVVILSTRGNRTPGSSRCNWLQLAGSAS